MKEPRDPVWWVETVQPPILSQQAQEVLFYVTTASVYLNLDTSGRREKVMGFDHALEMNLADQRRAAYHEKQRKKNG